MSGEESMVLGHIQASNTEGEPASCYPMFPLRYEHFIGIWTKHIKAKTELHQTVLDRCLKSLTQKALIKVVKSVKVRIILPESFAVGTHLDPSTQPGKSTCWHTSIRASS